MKTLLFSALGFLFTFGAFAQYQPKSTIATTGSAQKVFTPVLFRIRFLIQEEVTSENGKPVHKTSIDSLKQLLFSNLKAYGITASDLKLFKETSAPYNNYSGHPAVNLYAVIYDLNPVPINTAQKIVDDLRFSGLKGAVAKAQYPMVSPVVQDSLYKAALASAYKNAVYLAKQSGKTVGDVYNINSNNYPGDLNIAYDPEDVYSLSKFEIGMANSRPFIINVSITYLLNK